MFYAPTTLAEAGEALRNKSLRSVLVTGVKGDILVTRRDERRVEASTFGASRPYIIPLAFVIGISDRFKTTYMRKAQVAYDDADTALLVAQNIAAGVAGLYDRLSVDQQMNGYTGKMINLDMTIAVETEAVSA